MGEDAYAEVFLGTLIGTGYCTVVEWQGEPVGVIAGMLAPHPFNPDLTVATELWWWVTPEHRGSRAGLLLLDDFDAWANANAELVNMTLEAGSPIGDKVLLKRGYQLAEHQYLREVQ